MGQAVDSFSPPSILCRHLVPHTGLERDIKIIMINLRGWMRSHIKSKLVPLGHLHLSHLCQPWVEVLGTAQVSVPAMGPMLGHGQCSGLPAQTKGPWGCSCMGGTARLAAGWEHGGGTSYVLLPF